MYLRTLVAHWLRQKVRDQLHESVAEAVKRTGDAGEEDQPVPGTTLPPEPCDVGFVFALGIEAGGLVDRMADKITTRGVKLVEHTGNVEGRRVAIVESGVGREAARLGCVDLITVRRPQWIVSAGFAGGLCDEMRRGDILMADHVADSSGRSLSVGLRLDEQAIASQRSLHVGRLLTVDRVIAEPEEKQQLGRQHGALACDMETLAVAEACRDAKIRFISVRIISDIVGETLPREVENLVRQKSVAGKLGAFTGALFRDPASMKAMWKLKTEAIKLSERLAKFLCGTLPQLVARD